MKKIVCVPDSFKGSVSAAGAAAALAAGVAQVFPQAEILQVPFADGGEGTLDALLAAWGQQPEIVQTVDAIGRQRTARWGLSPDGTTAVIEAAQGNGLPAISDVPLQPLRADTYGVGLIIHQALQAGVQEILLCIGGSASTDAGTGILAALGARFLDSQGASVAPGGEGLREIASIDLSAVEPQAQEVSWRIAVDVENSLTGPQGAAAVFGPQKGATEADIAQLEGGLHHFAQQLAATTQIPLAEITDASGFGAAGGIPASLATVLGAEVVPGATMVADALGLDATLADADLVLTGEGRLDQQSLQGKVVSAVAQRSPSAAAVIVISGGLQLTYDQCQAAGITAAFSIADGAATLTELQERAADLIEQTAAQACALLAR